MFLFLSFLILFSTTFLLLCFLQIKEKVAFILAGYVISSGLIVLLVEFLSFFQSINATSIVILNLSLLIILLFITIYTRTQLYNPFRHFIKSIQKLFSGRFDLILFAEIMLIGFILFGVINWFFWPIEFDTVVYHIPRIVYWLQHQSLLPWEESILNPRITFPINAELIELWVTIFWGTEQLITFIPWFAGIITILAIYGLSTQLSFSRQSALFVSLIFGAIPVVGWQNKLILSHDINTCLYLIICIFFIFRWNNSGNNRDLIISGLGLGLALGTKLTAFFIIPGIGIMLFILVMKKNRRKNLKNSLVSFLHFGIPTLLLGSYIYLQNYHFFGNFLGSPTEINTIKTFDYSNIGGITRTIKCFQLNIFRNFYYVFIAGKSNLQQSIGQILSQVFSPTFIESNLCTSNISFTFIPTFFPIERSTGLQTPLFIMPGIIFAIHFSIKNKKSEIFYLLFLAFSYLIIHSLMMIWSPLARRYYITFFAILLPTCIPFLDLLTSKKIMRYLILMISITMYMGTQVIYEFNQLTGDLFEINPPQKYSNHIKRESLTPFIYYADQLIPKHSRVGIIFSTNWGLLEYPLWGQHFTRKLDRGVCGQVHADQIISDHVPYIIIGVECEEWFNDNLSQDYLNYELVFELGSASLYKHETAELNAYQINSPFAFPLDSPIVKISYVNDEDHPGLTLTPIVNRGKLETKNFIKDYRTISKSFEITHIDTDSNFHTELISSKPIIPVTVKVLLNPDKFEITSVFKLRVLDDNYQVIQETMSTLPLGNSNLIFKIYLEEGKNHILINTITKDMPNRLMVEQVEFIVGQ